MSGAPARWVPALLAAAAVAGAALLMAAAWRGDMRQAERARVAAETTAATLAQVQAKTNQGAQLQQQVADAQAQINTLTKERDDAIATATAGRTCLRSAAVRVLNGAPGIRVVAVPAAAASAAQAHARAAADTRDGLRPREPGTDPGADPGAQPDPEPEAQIADGAGPELIVTDTQIARWALQAGALYETCRARLHALIDYTTARPEPRP